MTSAKCVCDLFEPAEVSRAGGSVDVPVMSEDCVCTFEALTRSDCTKN